MSVIGGIAFRSFTKNINHNDCVADRLGKLVRLLESILWTSCVGTFLMWSTVVDSKVLHINHSTSLQCTWQYLHDLAESCKLPTCIVTSVLQRVVDWGVLPWYLINYCDELITATEARRYCCLVQGRDSCGGIGSTYDQLVMASSRYASHWAHASPRAEAAAQKVQT